ncbi:Fanconi anemia group M protein [Acipenser ruthenus]|uniref:Fanconi anemia group M protein n=1 Tax=Acipenser ruthenus TaxID=7906 RepID=A0A444V042_ACIRT|nr:Fanconi anemia group M protein [Acipenser ruthenus]
MGRTGRKRQGRIVVILAEGREERTYNQSQSNKRSIYKTILGNKKSFHMYQSSPRMLPEGVNPAAHKMHIATGEFEHKSKSKRCSTARRSGFQLLDSFMQPRTPGERSSRESGASVAQKGSVEGDFALCISLYHGYELLLQMGIRSLFLFMQGIMDGTKGMTRARNELSRNPDFMGLYQQMEAMFVDSRGASATRADRPFVYSHPKLRKLEEVVVEHFQSWSQREGQPCAGGATRVMIFSSFRESVQEIAEMLSRHQPLIKVMTFMGQSSAGKGVRGFTQKEQLEVVKRFREGGYNTLVSTCVGEEGLDIGELDLIVCFDAQKSPIRLSLL